MAGTPDTWMKRKQFIAILYYYSLLSLQINFYTAWLCHQGSPVSGSLSVSYPAGLRGACTQSGRNLQFSVKR